MPQMPVASHISHILAFQVSCTLKKNLGAITVWQIRYMYIIHVLYIHKMYMMACLLVCMNDIKYTVLYTVYVEADHKMYESS